METKTIPPLEWDQVSWEYCREYSEYREEQLHRLDGGHKLEVLDPHFETNYQKGVYNGISGLD